MAPSTPCASSSQETITSLPSALPSDETEPRLGELLVAEGIISEETLQYALDVQQRTGARLGQILLARGFITHKQLFCALAKLWGLPFVDLTQRSPEPDAIRGFDPYTFIEYHFLPLSIQDGVVEVATSERPNPQTIAQIKNILGDVDIRFLVTSDWDIDRAVLTNFREVILDTATYGLYYRDPDESAYTVLTPIQFFSAIIAILILITVFFFWPIPTLTFLNLIINIGFLGSIVFKFIVALAGAKYETAEPVTKEEVDALDEESLPVYTILVPVYQEANIVVKLMKNLLTLDYPPEKLEILLLLEENDTETIQAARQANPPDTVSFVIIPDSPPKTKPKACNVGLFLASGEYLVIFDAEDRPEPDQLKKAIVAFRKGDESLACVQAALNYFNAYENFLTKMFTLEYSYWFDYMLPGLDRLQLPIPLGGTSNHFRTNILRQLGGWDPFNVTEDADLGIRAATNGYTVGIINATTYEEANNELYNWIRQRSRWVKGYMQTTLVHLRHPVRLIKKSGWRTSMGFLFLVGGTPLTFLSSLLLWFVFLFWIVFRTKLFDFLFPTGILYVSMINFLIGNGLMIYLNMLAVVKRRYYRLLPYALLNPIYWILHAIAAYKALWQLITRPSYWEKTTHGISQVSEQTPT